MTDTTKTPEIGLGTLSVWAGEEGRFPAGATQVPVFHSVTFGYDDLDEWGRVARGEAPGHVYGRSSNPTTAVFEDKIRVLEDAEAAIAFSSGMAAVSNLFFTLLAAGDRVVSIRDSYGGTSKLFLGVLPRHGIDVVLSTRPITRRRSRPNGRPGTSWRCAPRRRPRAPMAAG